MYLLDFMKKMIRKSNIAVMIYLVLNVFVISGLFMIIFNKKGFSFVDSLIVGLGLYTMSLVIALSPIGEWILRKHNKCQKIKNENIRQFIEPLFDEVYQAAKIIDSSLPDDIQLFICQDESANAFATGRRTICITQGLLSLSPEAIKGAIAHEFGHLCHKDTDLILVVVVGNCIVTLLMIFINILIMIIRYICHMFSDGLGKYVATALTFIFVNGIMWIWNKIGFMLVMKSSRSNEYQADEFANELGYGAELCHLLSCFGQSESKGLFASLQSSHPANEDRIARLQKIGFYTKLDLQQSAPQAKRFCQNCGHLVEESDSIYCVHCGVELFVD